MVNALVKLNDETNRMLNIVKAKFGLKDKGEAIEYVVNQYVSEEPTLKVEFIDKMRSIEKQKSTRVDDLGSRYGV